MRTFITLRLINRKITYFGLGGIQISVLFILGLLLLIISRFFAVLYFGIVFLLLKKYQEKSSKGDPDYMSTWRLSKKSPVYLQDRLPE